jgi:hypothetical protein
MKLWVDVLGFIKRGTIGGGSGFFTYMEVSACSSYFMKQEKA